MQYVYAACAFAALIRLRRSPFVFFRIFLAASIMSRLCWRPTLDAAWWKWWLVISEPLVLTLTLLSLIECGHFATIRCFPSARRSLLAMALLFGSVGCVFTFWMEDTPVEVMTGLRVCAQTGIAMTALFGLLALWWKADKQDPMVWEHAATLTVFVTGNAAVGIWSKFIHDDPYHWWMASTVSWAVSSACMVHWSFIVPLAPSHDSSGAQSPC
jgi:hypothetical protein